MGFECRCFILVFSSTLWITQLANNVRWIFRKNATRHGSRDSGSNGCIKAGTLFTTPCGTRHQGMHKLRVKDRCLRQKRRSAFIPPLFLSQSRRCERACIIIKCATCIFLNSDYTAESRITFLVFHVDILSRKEIWNFS